jgi:hypothetical protein
VVHREVGEVEAGDPGDGGQGVVERAAQFLGYRGEIGAGGSPCRR